MDSEQTSKNSWLAGGALLLSSAPILLIILGIFSEAITLWRESLQPVRSGVVNVTIRLAVIQLGLYLAFPCGLVNLIFGNFAHAKGLIGRKALNVGKVIGILGLLFGLCAWILFAMVSAIEF